MVTDRDWSRADTTPSIVEVHHMHYEVLRGKESRRKFSLRCFVPTVLNSDSSSLVRVAKLLGHSVLGPNS